MTGTTRETSAGIVIYRKGRSGTKFLLLHYPSGHWDFVKGKTENGESMVQTAFRETLEETGLSDIELVDGFKESIRYEFQHNGRPISKKVVFFLGRTRTKNITISHEHLAYAWENYGGAMKKITYMNSRSVLAKSRLALEKAGM